MIKGQGGPRVTERNKSCSGVRKPIGVIEKRIDHSNQVQNRMRLSQRSYGTKRALNFRKISMGVDSPISCLRNRPVCSSKY